MILNLDAEQREKQLYLIDTLGTEEILSILSEEAAELTQAAQKVRRVLHGTTPVTMQKSLYNLSEEVGDVLLLLDCLEHMGYLNISDSIDSSKWKLDRWYRRTVFDMNA